MPLVAHQLDSFGALDKLDGFASLFGRNFYGLPVDGLPTVTIKRTTRKVVENYALNGEAVIPFWSGKEIDWEIVDQ